MAGTRTAVDVDVAFAASLFADPARAAMVDALMDGTSHPAGELARRASVAPSTASEHLSKLLAGGVVTCEARGRERRYRLASRDVAEAVEALARIAPAAQVRTLRGASARDAIRTARTCYDHLAGQVGVGLTEALVAGGTLQPVDCSYEVTVEGETVLAELGVDVAAARARRRSFARACLDWSERRDHLAGALGAAVAEALLSQRWFERRPHDRGLVVTGTGRARLAELGVVLP